MNETSLLRNPRAGQTPLSKLLLPRRILLPEDYAFGNQAALTAHHRISESAVANLAKLSIQTQEQLLGYLETPDLPTEDFASAVDLPAQALPGLREFLEKTLDRDTVSAFAEVSREEYAFGAVPPPAEPGPEPEAKVPEADGVVISAPCLPTVKDQGRRGTCVAHAACAVVEFGYCTQHGRALDLSEQFLFWQKESKGSGMNIDIFLQE